jgi:hypothetical protein
MMDTHELPPPVQMVQLLAGFQLSQALYAAAVLKVPDALLAGARPVGEIAERTGAHAPSLERLMRTLAGIGVFTEVSPGTFALTPLGETLTSDGQGSMRDLALVWMETHYAPFGQLVDTIRTGEPAAQRFYGVPFFDWLATQPAQVSRFTGAMRNLTDGIKAAAVSIVRLEGVKRLVDVGGADGSMLAVLLAKHPDTCGVVFDLPHVVAHTPKSIAERGLADRVTCVGGDFFESVPHGDGYLVSMVLHDWNDEQAARILRNIAAAGGPDASLTLVEFVVPAGDTPHMAKMIDLTMLGMLPGHERTEPQWRTLLESCGFRDIEVHETPAPISVIRAVVDRVTDTVAAT